MSDALGLFGGTFDPVHFGHLRLAEEAIGQLGLAGVRWIPAGQPPHRDRPQVAPADRLALVRQATADNPCFTVDAAEVESPQASYTVHTLERLRRELGREQPLVLLLGADAFAGLPTWHRWGELFDLAHIAVSHRPGFPIAAEHLPAELAEVYAARHCATPDEITGRAAGGIITFAMTQLAISATQIRHLLMNGRSPRYLLPDGVLDYIYQHHLYQSF